MKVKHSRFHALKEQLIRLGETNITGVRYLPRYAVVLLDLLLLVTALGLSQLIMLTIGVRPHGVLPLWVEMSVVLGVNLYFFYLIKTYAGLIRHSSFIDILKLSLAQGATLNAIAVVHYGYYVVYGTEVFLMTGLLFYALLSFTFLLIFRISVKQVYQSFRGIRKERKRIAILGVDDDSISLGNAILMESTQDYQLVGFLSTQLNLQHMQIGGKPVIPVRGALEDTLTQLDIDGVLVISQALSIKEKNEIVNSCLSVGLQVFNAPLMEEWNSAADVTRQIKSIEIEDLLERETIHLEEESISNDLRGKSVLITGAAGSIGSELVRQIARYAPREMILVDQAETPLYALELEIRETWPEQELHMVLANVSNKHRIRAVFEQYAVEVVYHAAAYKHVPMIEINPREAIVVNLLGSINLAQLSSEFEVEKFVMVSTDKAVNPTNVMGASKRAAEMYVQSFQNSSGNRTQFITTRFGNVLGSNGSVIPFFKKQIAKGGPVTVTHRDIIRYFMTIPEACQLVLQAGTMGNGGEIFVFDMGKPVKILHLAERMIKLSGFTPYVDIDIKFTGLRPGEKLYEELLSDCSKTLPTPNKKIMIARDEPLAFEWVHRQAKCVIKAAVKEKDTLEMVRLMKVMVPEFKSKNSAYEALDAVQTLKKV